MNNRIIDDDDIVVLRLRCAGNSRDEIAKTLNLGAGSVSRSLDNLGQIIGDDVMDCLGNVGRVARKVKQGQPLPGPREMGAGVIKASKISDPVLLASEISKAGGLLPANALIHTQSIKLTKTIEYKRAELEAVSHESEKASRFRDYMMDQAKCFYYQEELGAFTQAVAGVGECTNQQTVNAISFVIGGALKKLPPKASCRLALERALWAVRNDLTIIHDIPLGWGVSTDHSVSQRKSDRGNFLS